MTGRKEVIYTWRKVNARVTVLDGMQGDAGVWVYGK